MTQGWDFDAKPQGQGGEKTNFTKFPEGITRIRVVDPAPHMRWTHWLKQYQRSVNCPGRGCPIDEIRNRQKQNGETPSYPMSKRFAINIINRETGKLEVCEQGKTFMEDLRDLMTDLKEKGKSLIDVDIKVRRRGLGQEDTSYRLDIDEEYPLSEADLKLLDEKVELAEYFKPHTPEQILKLINFTAPSKDDYLKHWIEVTSNAPTEGASTSDSGDGEVGEEIELR